MLTYEQHLLLVGREHRRLAAEDVALAEDESGDDKVGAVAMDTLGRVVRRDAGPRHLPDLMHRDVGTDMRRVRAEHGGRRP